MDEARLDEIAEAAWKHRCQRMAEAKERPPIPVTWADRAPFLKEIDRSVCSLVAAMAVADAGLQCEADTMELARYRAHRAVIIRGLVAGEHAQDTTAGMKPFRDALEALGPLRGAPSSEEESRDAG
jgi:hypothetical protein